MKTESYWVCNKCNKPVAKKGRGLHAAIRNHRKECLFTTVSLKQVPQK
jgi:hypothetical protein